jgi:hypothetical protein
MYLAESTVVNENDKDDLIIIQLIPYKLIMINM